MISLSFSLSLSLAAFPSIINYFYYVIITAIIIIIVSITMIMIMIIPGLKLPPASARRGRGCGRRDFGAVSRSLQGLSVNTSHPSWKK